MKLSAAIKFAFIFGLLACVVWYALAVKVGFYAVEVYLYRYLVFLGALLVGIPLSIFLHKRQHGGYLQFKEALKEGMLFAFVFAFVIALFNHIYHAHIATDAIDYFLSEAKKAALAHGQKIEDIPKILDAEKSNFSSFRLIPSILFEGLIISLLSGAIFQKPNLNKTN
jgi:hypothetical protein